VFIYLFVFLFNTGNSFIF